MATPKTAEKTAEKVQTVAPKADTAIARATQSTGAAVPVFEEYALGMGEPWKPANPGDYIEGRYIGYRDIKNPLAEASGKEISRAYMFADNETGMRFVYGAGLDELSKLPPGVYARMTFKGMVPARIGQMKVFKCQAAPNMGILDVSPLAKLSRMYEAALAAAAASATPAQLGSGE